MSDPKTFLWAQGQDANVKEPIEALREHGWRYGDVPAASNFNWLFKTMTEQLAIQQKDLLIQREQFSRLIDEQGKKLSEAIAQLERSLAANLRATTSTLTDKILRVEERQNNKAKQLATSLEITWDSLRNLQDMIRHYHPNMPLINWPESVWPRINELDDDAE